VRAIRDHPPLGDDRLNRNDRRQEDRSVMTITTRQPSGRDAVILRRWDPFRVMEDLYDRMGQLMQGYLADPAVASYAPADIEETDDAYLVEVDLPNVRPGDVDIALRGNELWITGEIKDRERTGVLRRRERRIGRFEHVIALPGEVDPDRVEATLRDGVLTVRLRKTEANRGRHIDVKTG
jgi:HSP20 family protein